MGRRLKRALIGVPVGLLGASALTFAIGIALPEVLPISQFEGAYAMQVAFFFTPIAGLIGAIAGLIWALNPRQQ